LTTAKTLHLSDSNLSSEVVAVRAVHKRLCDQRGLSNADKRGFQMRTSEVSGAKHNKVIEIYGVSAWTRGGGS